VGGAISVENASANIENCFFAYNKSDRGGAVKMAVGAITGCTFESNEAGSGGAIHIRHEVPISDCIFTSNLAAIGYGGAIDIFLGSGSDIEMEINDCVFAGNTAQFGGGGIVAINDGGNLSLSIKNSLFQGNSVEENYFNGGSLETMYTSLQLNNCTFVGSRSQAGGVIKLRNTPNASGEISTTISNCIIRNNITLPDSQIQYDFDPSEFPLNIYYCNIEGGSPVAGTGNIDVDPLFADPGSWDQNGTPTDPNDDIWISGDHHLQSQAGRYDSTSQSWVIDSITSPCVDAGDLSTPIGWEPYPNGGVVNMGAYGATAETSKSYFGTTPCETPIAGDINGDCSVDLLDFSIMAFHWLEDNS